MVDVKSTSSGMAHLESVHVHTLTSPASPCSLESTSRTLEYLPLLRATSLVVLTMQNAILVLVMRYARTRPGDMFISTTAVVMAEAVKLVFCLTVILAQKQFSIRAWLQNLNENILQQPFDFLKICVPAVIYMIQNNLLYVALSNLDASVFQVTYQLKLLTTAMFSVTMLHKQLSRLQWIALVVLFCGIGIVQMQPSDKSAAAVAKTVGTQHHQNPTVGMLAVLTACVMSGFASVYFEKLLKHTSPTIYMRNVQLGFIGVVFGICATLFNDGQKIAAKGFFVGYDPIVWIVIFLQSLGGIMVAVVVKYADNILKGFASSAAIVISCLVSFMSFGVTLSMEFTIGALLVIASVCIYGIFVPLPPVVK